VIERRYTVYAMPRNGVGINNHYAVDGSGRNANASIGPSGEIGADFVRIGGHPPLAATAMLFRLVGFL
jgi:hypothetical protein